MILFAAKMTLICQFSLYGNPFISTAISFDENLHPGSEVEVTYYGKKTNFPLRVNSIEENEIWNLEIAPDDPDNQLNLKIYQHANGTYPAKLFNPSIPIGNESEGICRPQAVTH